MNREVGAIHRCEHRRARILQTLRERSNWGRKPGAGRGQGIACTIYDGDTHFGYVVEVTANERSWHIDRVVCAVDTGAVVNPSGVEIVAGLAARTS